MSSFVPEGWLKRQLSSIATLEYGKSPNHVRQEEGQYPIVGTSGIVGTANQYLWGEKSVVIGRKGTINTPIYIETPFWAIDTTYFCKFAEDTDPKWFYYKVCEEQLEKHNEASGVPSLSRDTIRGLPIEIPPLPEQKKIASILTSVDEVIENTQKQIDKLQDLKKATMNELLTKGIGHTEFKDSELGRIPKSWKVVTLEEISEALIDYRGKSPPKSGNGIPLITAKNIRMGFINIEPKEYIQETSFDQWMIKGIPKLGDIFFTTEAPMGYVALVPEYKHAVGQRVITISPRREIFDPHFLCYQLQGETFQKQLIDSSTGSTVTGIKQSTLRKILLLVVPLAEQLKIAKMVSSIDNRINRVSTKLAQTQSLKKSLMQDLLTGKVRVTVN